VIESAANPLVREPGHRTHLASDPIISQYFKPDASSPIAPEKERVRQDLNTWMRGSEEFDGVIDFDEVLRDPNHPGRLVPDYDSGHHLHANDAGYTASAMTFLLRCSTVDKRWPALVGYWCVARIRPGGASVVLRTVQMDRNIGNIEGPLDRSGHAELQSNTMLL
jgi:hypothetical protein